MLRDEMRHYVTIVAPTKTQNAFGEFTEDATSTKGVWAKVEPLNAKQVLEASANRGMVTHRIVMRHTTGVTTDCYITWGSRTFDIGGVRNINENNHWLEIIATERTNA